MNKKRVNSLLLVAKQALDECGIAENGKINSAFRGQISSFGAAIVTGNLPAATAFFSVQGGSDVKRDRLLNIIFRNSYEKADASISLRLSDFEGELKNLLANVNADKINAAFTAFLMVIFYVENMCNRLKVNKNKKILL